MMTASVTAEEMFRTHLAQLGNETKSRLIELLASSLVFPAKKSKSSVLWNDIYGSWDDGISAEETIKSIHEARVQGTTRNIAQL